MDSNVPLSFSELIVLPNFRVPPLEWSQAHLDLVGCRFEDTWEHVEYDGAEQQQQGSAGHGNDADGAWVGHTKRAPAPVSEQKTLDGQLAAQIRDGVLSTKTLFMEHLLMGKESLFVEAT